MKIDKALLKNKVIISIVATYVILAIYPILFFTGTTHNLENNLAVLDVSRSSVLFTFDSVFLLFIVMVPFMLLLILIVKRRLRILKEAIIVLLLFMLIITPSLSIVNNFIIHAEPERETPLLNKVIIITFDGTRADAFWKHADFIIAHKNEGTWAKRIVCTYPTVTYPNHVSLFTGTWPQYHGTESNPTEYRSVQFMLRVYREPKAQDIFTVAENYEIATAIFTAPQTLAQILGGSATYRYSGGAGGEVVSEAINFMISNKATIESKGLLAFIHIVDTDDIMHQYGTDSVQYFSAIKGAADLVGQIYDVIHDLGWENDTAIIVTADHGATDRRHYGVWPVMVADTPLWLWGRAFKKNYELGGGRIIDIAPTVAYILGIPPPAQSKGIVLYSAFDESYIESKRGIDVDLNALAKGALNKALLDETIEIYLWGFLTLTMIWIILIEANYAFRSIKLLAIEEKRKKAK